jgi:predicted O-linked N-acetylglucosamine transferase (SPINDLY family)
MPELPLVSRGLSPAPKPQQAWHEADWLAHCAALQGQAGVAAELAPVRAALQQACQCLPGSVRLWHNLAVCAFQEGDPHAATHAWARVIELDPAHVPALRGLVAVACRLGDGWAACEHASHLLRAQAQLPSAHLLMGRALLLAGHWDEALACYEALAERLRQGEFEPLLPVDALDLARGLRWSRVLCWRAQGELADFMAPHGWDGPAWLNDQAQDHAAQAFAWDRAPPMGDVEVQALCALAEACMVRLKACDWRERETWQRALTRLAQRAMADPQLGLPRALPWDALASGLSAPLQQALARATVQRIRQIQSPQPMCPPQSRLGGRRTPGALGRLKLGYLSINFHEHPSAQLIHQVLRDHDRQHFEVVAYAMNPRDASAERRAIEAAVDTLVDVHGLSPQAVAERIHADGVDLLVGLGGHAYGPVIDVCLWRPAPVQVNYLSCCGTTGAGDAFDAHIADAFALPPELAQWYDERVITLPGGHYAYNDERPLALPPARCDLGLPEAAVVLCAFNNSYKIEPATFAAWCQVLQGVPGSVLWLYSVHPEQRRHVVQAALRAGIEPARLVWADPVGSEAHLARLSQADLFLDAFDYNGHTTMLDILFAGVPAVTRAGHTPASRIAGGILTEAGLPDWVAHDTPAYVAKAVQLGLDAPLRHTLRAHLREGRERKRLPFNSAARCRQLEAAYRELCVGPQELAPHVHGMWEGSGTLTMRSP